MVRAGIRAVRRARAVRAPSCSIDEEVTRHRRRCGPASSGPRARLERRGDRAARHGVGSGVGSGTGVSPT